jgi:hypothetical protein
MRNSSFVRSLYHDNQNKLSSQIPNKTNVNRLNQKKKIKESKFKNGHEALIIVIAPLCWCKLVPNDSNLVPEALIILN